MVGCWCERHTEGRAVGTVVVPIQLPMPATRGIAIVAAQDSRRTGGCEVGEMHASQGNAPYHAGLAMA